MSLTSKWYGFGKSEAYDEGMRRYDRGEFGEAIASFTHALQSTHEPATERLARFYLVESYRRHAEALLKANQSAAALEIVRQAIELKPSYPDLRVLEAKAFEAQGNPAEALRAADEALDINPKYVEARYWRGVAQYALGMREEGFGAVRDALERFRGRVPAAYGAALAAHEEKNYASALDQLRSISLQESDETGALIRQGDDMLGQGAFSEAAACYHSALEASPQYADVRCKYGQVLAELDDLAGAEAQLREALTINPRYAEACAQMGIVLKRQGKAEESKEWFAKTLQLNPHHPIASMEVSRRQ